VVPAKDVSDLPETRVLVVDDHRSFADLLSGALSSVPGMTCVGTASSAAEAIALTVALEPDIVVMDIQMPQQDGLAATRRIREMVPDAMIAVVTAHTDLEWISRASQAGASAFIPKDGSLSEMIDVLSRIGPGQMLVAPSAFRSALPHPATPPGEIAPDLTQRELEVLRSLGRGMHASQIAKALGISLHTCRGYVKSLHAKLGVSSQLEAVIKAQNLGIIGTSAEL
jgi:DNA-binding NarL/FixJ family response regulator